MPASRRHRSPGAPGWRGRSPRRRRPGRPPGPTRSRIHRPPRWPTCGTPCWRRSGCGSRRLTSGSPLYEQPTTHWNSSGNQRGGSAPAQAGSAVPPTPATPGSTKGSASCSSQFGSASASSSRKAMSWWEATSTPVLRAEERPRGPVLATTRTGRPARATRARRRSMSLLSMTRTTSSAVVTWASQRVEGGVEPVPPLLGEGAHDDRPPGERSPGRIGSAPLEVARDHVIPPRRSAPGGGAHGATRGRW